MKITRKAVFLGLMALTGILSAWAAAPSGDPAAVIAALVAKPPQVLSELEAILGSLHRDPWSAEGSQIISLVAFPPLL